MPGKLGRNGGLRMLRSGGNEILRYAVCVFDDWPRPKRFMGRIVWTQDPIKAVRHQIDLVEQPEFSKCVAVTIDTDCPDSYEWLLKYVLDVGTNPPIGMNCRSLQCQEKREKTMIEACSPCPHCNSKNDITWEGPDHEDCVVRCGACGTQTEKPMELLDAIDAWNILNSTHS